LRELVPGSTVAGSKEGLRSFVSPEVLNIYADGLLKAGLPEG
jgi:hypothetical protein